MWRVYVVGLLALAAVIITIVMVLAKRTPKKTISRDDPLYRGLIEFTRKVAYFNDTTPEGPNVSLLEGWAVMIPVELSHEARQLLDQEKKELRIRNES